MIGLAAQPQKTAVNPFLAQPGAPQPSRLGFEYRTLAILPATLTLGHVQQRDNRWCIIDLIGKHGRVRTIPMPAWVKGAIDSWISAIEFSDGPVLRRVSRGDQVQAAGMSEKVVWQLLQVYAAAGGLPGIAPCDLRRTCAKLCRAAGGDLEQIQLLLGHQSVQTTERYLGTRQDLMHAPNDGIKLRVVV